VSQFNNYYANMIKITQGSIFDHKCDLLAIPCSSGGSVTSTVFRELQSRRLPTELGGIPYGSVHFRNVQYENASVLAYSASVYGKGRGSDSDALSNIAKELVSYCQKNQISLANIPLLGTGAGGMTPGESFEIMRSFFEKDQSTTYVIYCFSSDVFENLAVRIEAIDEIEEDEHPRVFISYTGNDKANSLWVKQLVIALRERGVDARLDQFHLKPGYDLPQWMTNEVIMAEKVLLICDSYYMEKADFRKGGVGWETMIIQGDMLAQGDTKTKYIALIREEQVEKALPIYMRSKYALNWGKKEQFDEQALKELILLLYDRDNEPPLGKAPTYVKNSKKTLSR
jgi:TIR domain